MSELAMNKMSQIRRSLAVSQLDLASALGVGQSTISQYENDGCAPSIDVAMKLISFAAARGMTLTLDQIYSVNANRSADAMEEFFTKPHPLVTDTWTDDDDAEHSTVHTHRIADTTRAANGIRIISRLIHNSLGQPGMSGAQPLDVGSMQHLMNAIECLSDYVFDQMEGMRETASDHAAYKRQQGAAHG